jgi:hypothetical protein
LGSGWGGGTSTYFWIYCFSSIFGDYSTFLRLRTGGRITGASLTTGFGSYSAGWLSETIYLIFFY